MAGYVGESSSSQAIQQQALSQEEVPAAGRWYMSRKEIEENSPSRRDSIDLKKETYLRKSYCTFLQDLGMRLKVPQVTIATAIIFCHRFFLRQSHARNDRRTIATVCMFLAGKVEETPRPLKDVILVSYEIIHKKDQSAAQRIKQKEVYEQQKELILVGERVVLATLGFDLNVHHPYKPLVDSIKKFRVAQNALAQVAWNFVNDGLRTSLCLQFMPHHIAAGAIFLAAKFLKVKLPSDGERAWWQEFDVTPRQLEEVSNQMLELYEQNRVPPPSQGSEIDGSAGGGVGSGHRASSAKVSSSHEELGGSRQVSSRAAPPTTDHLVDEVAPTTTTQSQNNDRGSADMGSDITDHKVDAAEQQLPLRGEVAPPPPPPPPPTNSSRLKVGVEGEDHERRRNEGGVEAGDDGASHKPMRHLEVRGGGEGSVGHSSCSPKEAGIKIDKDKVKAALEKTRKARAEMTKKRGMSGGGDDDDDLIERELEDGVELAAAEEKKRSSWSNKTSAEEETTAKETFAEEGEMLEDVSPAIPNRKRKGSPLKRHENGGDRMMSTTGGRKRHSHDAHS